MKIKKFDFKSIKKKSSTASAGQCAGIDVTAKSINMVLLSERSLNQIRLEKYLIFPLPRNVVSGSEVSDHDQFVALLQQAWKEFKPGTSNIVAALPQKSVSIRTLPYNAVQSGLDMEEFVQSELGSENHGESVSYDFFCPEDTDSANRNLLVASCARNETDLLNDDFTAAGITPTTITVDILAVVNAFNTWINLCEPGLVDKVVALFDIGDTETRAIIMHKGMPVYRQEMNIGFENLVRLVRSNYQLTEEDAYQVIYAVEKPEQYGEKVNAAFQEQLIREIQRTLQFFYASIGNEKEMEVRQLLVSGYSGAGTENLDGQLRAQTGISALQINPIELVGLSKKTDPAQFAQDSNILTAAFGLAVGGL